MAEIWPKKRWPNWVNFRRRPSSAAESIPAVVNRLRDVDIAPISLTLTQPTLDDVFLQVTGERLRDEAQPAGALVANGKPKKRGR